MSQPGLNLRVGPGLLPLAATLSAVWDMACHSHKADVCMNCQKETKTTLWEAEGWVRKRKFPSFLDEKVETLNKALCIHSDDPACLFLRCAPFGRKKKRQMMKGQRKGSQAGRPTDFQLS